MAMACSVCADSICSSVRMRFVLRPVESKLVVRVCALENAQRNWSSKRFVFVGGRHE